MTARPSRPSWRHGLPYGWWRNESVVSGAAGLLCAAIVVVMVTALALAWLDLL